MADIEYSVRVKNESGRAWKFVVYQEPPFGPYTPLAWLATPYHVYDFVFSWNLTYQFVWSSTGVLLPGVNFNTKGEVDCNPDGNNITHFTVANDTPLFSHPTPGGDNGTLTITSGADVPATTYSVGVAMSQKATYAVNTGPNLTHKFTPFPTYWICIMPDVNQGDVLDLRTITTSAKLKFEDNKNNIEATLQANYNWSIEAK